MLSFGLQQGPCGIVGMGNIGKIFVALPFSVVDKAIHELATDLLPL